MKEQFYSNILWNWTLHKDSSGYNIIIKIKYHGHKVEYIRHESKRKLKKLGIRLGIEPRTFWYLVRHSYHLSHWTPWWQRSAGLYWTQSYTCSFKTKCIISYITLIQKWQEEILTILIQFRLSRYDITYIIHY